MNWLDRAIGAVSPGAGLRRVRQRHALRLVQRAYEGAKAGRRTEGWVTAGTGANAEIGPASSRLRDRSRDLVRNNPYAAKAVNALVSNLVGTGIVPRARSRKLAAARQADQLWLQFAASCDADGLTDFGGLHVPFQLQVLEPDHLDSGKTEDLADGGYILQGNEIMFGRLNAVGHHSPLCMLAPSSRTFVSPPSSSSDSDKRDIIPLMTGRWYGSIIR